MCVRADVNTHTDETFCLSPVRVYGVCMVCVVCVWCVCDVCMCVCVCAYVYMHLCVHAPHVHVKNS